MTTVLQQQLGPQDLEGVATPHPVHLAGNRVERLGVGIRDAVLEVVEDFGAPVVHRPLQVAEGWLNLRVQVLQPLLVGCLALLAGPVVPDGTERLLGSPRLVQQGELAQHGFQDDGLTRTEVLGVTQKEPAVILHLKPLLGGKAGTQFLPDALHRFATHAGNMESVHHDLGLWQDSLHGQPVGLIHVHSDVRDDVPVLQSGQVSDDGLLLPVLQQVNDGPLLHVGNDAAVGVHDVQFVNAQPLGGDWGKAVQFSLGMVAPNVAHGHHVHADLIGESGERPLGAEGLDVFDQPLGHVVLGMHVRHLFVVGPLAAGALVTLPLDPDADLPTMARRIEEHALSAAVLPHGGEQATTGRGRANDGGFDLILAGVFDTVHLNEVRQIQDGFGRHGRNG